MRRCDLPDSIQFGTQSVRPRRSRRISLSKQMSIGGMLSFCTLWMILLELTGRVKQCLPKAFFWKHEENRIFSAATLLHVRGAEKEGSENHQYACRRVCDTMTASCLLRDERWIYSFYDVTVMKFQSSETDFFEEKKCFLSKAGQSFPSK